MDFGTLLHVAKKKSQESADKTRCYSTKFAPPKKESRDKKLSANIQKFLAKKEQEERAKEEEKVRKRNELLAMRDTKSKNKINKMLKVIKSANKAAIADAVDTENTAVTLHGPDQPDEDDYGYVSQEASAFYSKMMEKYKSQPEEDKFAPVRRKNIPATAQPVEVRKSSKDTKDHPPVKRNDMPPPPQAKEDKPKPKKAPPPPVDFQSLLKLAEKKQHEPIEIVQEVKKKKEPERPLTQKEKEEREQRLAILKAKKQRMAEAMGKIKPPNGNILKKALTGAAPPAPSTSTAKDKPPQPGTSKKTDLTSNTKDVKDSRNLVEKKLPGKVEKINGKAPEKPQRREGESIKPRPRAETVKPRESLLKEPQKTREFPPKDVQRPKDPQRPKEVQKTREFPPRDVQRAREFPPRDVQRPKARPEVRRPPPKRMRIEDDDSEYDSEMDDFIDDGDADDDYSKHIRDIFGYDRSRYRDEDDDDRDMESSFAQQMREELISKKIGLMEDLEDMRQEELEKEEKRRRKEKEKKRRT
ncbi:protein SPT2 homolog [Lutzomyia longipalpis]|uniref:protein SPT2 homolog n=1 Tax=Lutzomyia longipalpis TaxID=7200 RepID=UPI0024833444|nr:protein SPT2 homolog [Lutzomyia longipalpis]